MDGNAESFGPLSVNDVAYVGGGPTDHYSSTDMVNHPPHYGGDTIYEVIKVLEAWELGFHLGNAVKYIARAGKKSPDQLNDLLKARWYLDRYISNLEKSHAS